MILFIPLEQLRMDYNVMIIRILYGLGRGVFEGVCRAVYTEMFTGDDLSASFASQTLLAGFSGGMSFFILGLKPYKSMALIGTMNGFLAIVCYHIIMIKDHTKPLRWSSLFCGNGNSDNDINYDMNSLHK